MIGAIADDFTGGTDVAVFIRREGLRTILFFGLPPASTVLPACDAVVIALKSRMLPADDAVSQSLEASDWLRAHGAQQIYFKYCSTFDSTPRGNIGPVLDALADSLGARTVIQTPSSPEHLRTQYQGYLFVNDLLLSESHMRNHPLTPMTDSSLPRVLRAQTKERVAVITHQTVRSGAHAIRAAVSEAESRCDRYLLADAVDEDDLRAIGRAALGAPLVAGAAGLGGGLAAAVAGASSSLVGESFDLGDTKIAGGGPAAVLAGSCSKRTLEQIAVLKERGHPSFRLDALAGRDSAALAADALAWFDRLPKGRAPLIYSSLDSVELKHVQEILGVGESAGVLEDATGRIAVGLVDRGVTRVIAAGGETSGAVVTALGVSGGMIGPEPAPGVPWIFTTEGERIALLLKSGNFGAPDLLAEASTRPLHETASTRPGTTTNAPASSPPHARSSPSR